MILQMIQMKKVIQVSLEQKEKNLRKNQKIKKKGKGRNISNYKDRSLINTKRSQSVKTLKSKNKHKMLRTTRSEIRKKIINSLIEQFKVKKVL